MGRCTTLAARLVLLLNVIHGRAAPDTCQEPDKQVLMQLRNARQKGLLDTSSTFKQLPVLQLFFPFGNPVVPTGNSSGPTLPNGPNVTEQFECVVPIPPGASSDKWVPCLNIAERLQLQQDVADASSNASQPNLTEYLQSGAWDPAGKWAIPMDFWNDFRCNCPNCADEEELFTAVAYAVQGSLLTLVDNFTDYVLDCTSCGGCPSQDQCGAVVDCDPDALALIPSCALKLQEDGWNIDYLHDCGNGFKIPQSYVNDLEYCDCPDCSDEDNFNCSTCNSECPTECGYWALCGSNATFHLNPVCQEANILWDARGGYKACNNGWTIPADYWNDEFYCDCPDCEDETFSCEACGGCPNASAACGDYVECYTSDSILPQLNPQCILAALSGWAPAKITSCNASDPEAWNITLDYINDGYCDCPNCEDEDQWTCDNCSVGCPQRCGDSVQCLDEQNFKECGNNEIFGSGSDYYDYYGYYYYGYGYDDTAFAPFDDGDDGITNLLSKNARTSKRSLKRRTGGAARHSSGNSTSNSPYFVCNNGWTIWADYYDDKEYCDCRDCEDEPDITLESCGIQPLNFCGDYAYCGSGPKEEQGACTYETWQLGDNPVVCSNGWTKPQDTRNNNFCDCPNCEDENETGWNCDNCYCPQDQCIDNGACFAGISSLFGFVGTFQAPPPGTTTPGTTSSPGTTPATTPSPGGTGYYGRYAYKKGAFPWHYWRASTGWQRKNWWKNRGYSLTQQEAQQRAAERKTNVNQERRVLRSMLASEGCNFLNCVSQAWDKGTETAKNTYNDVEKKAATAAENGAAWASGAANAAVKWGTQAGGAVAEWTADQAIDAATFYRVGAENFAAVVANFAQEGAELAQEAAENAADFFMSAFDTGKEIIIKFLGDQLSNILNEDNLQPRPTFCGGVAFPWLASTVVGDPNNACWKQVIGLTEEIAEFVSDDVGRLVDAVITRVSNMLEDEDLWKAIIGKLGNALITSIGTPGGITATRAVEIYNDIMAVMVTYLKTHLTPLFADLAAFFADVGRFLEAMSERTKNLISAVFDEPNGPFNFLGFQGETWYVALCLEGFTFGMFLGTCLYYPFKFGASDNDYFVVELGWGRERELGSGNEVSLDAGFGGGIQLGPIMTNDKSALEGKSFSIGLDIDFETKNPKIPNINVGPALTWGVSPITLLTVDFYAGINWAVPEGNPADSPVSFYRWTSKQYAWKLPGLQQILGALLGNLFETGPTTNPNYNAVGTGTVTLVESLKARSNRTSHKQQQSMDRLLIFGGKSGDSGGGGVGSAVGSTMNMGGSALGSAMSSLSSGFSFPTVEVNVEPVSSPGPPPPPPIPEPAQVDDVWLRGVLTATGSPLEGPLELPAKRRWIYVRGADCAVGTAVTTLEECKEASTYLKNTPDRGTELSVTEGAWGSVPLGCSIIGDKIGGVRKYQRVHWNSNSRTDSARAATDEFRAICRRPFYVGQQRQRDCLGGARILRKEDCVAAYMQLQSSFKKILQPRQELPQMNPTDVRIPPACSIEFDVTDKRQLFFVTDTNKAFSPEAGSDYVRPVCKKQLYWLERQGASSCPRGSQITSWEDCENAYENLKERFPRLRGRTGRWANTWDHVLPGCSVQYRGDMTPHFNDNMAPANIAGAVGLYVPMCKQPSWWLGENKGACPLGTEITTFLECKMAHKALTYEYPNALPKRSFVVVDVNTIPRGCSVPRDAADPHGPDAHFNFGKGNNVGDGWFPICKPARYVLARRTTRSCPSGAEIRTAEECTRAHNALKKEIKKTYGGWRSKGLISVNDPGNEIPPFCSSGGGPDTSPYWNINTASAGTGADSGKYRPVCKVPVTGQEVPVTDPPVLGPVREKAVMLNTLEYTCEPRTVNFDPSWQQARTLKLALVCCDIPFTRAAVVKSGATCSPAGLTWDLAKRACEDRGERLCNRNEVDPDAARARSFISGQCSSSPGVGNGYWTNEPCA